MNTRFNWAWFWKTALEHFRHIRDIKIGYEGKNAILYQNLQLFADQWQQFKTELQKAVVNFWTARFCTDLVMKLGEVDENQSNLKKT